MIDANHYARMAAFLELDPAESASELADENNITVENARKLIDDAIRERQELDVHDTHTDLLDEHAKETEHAGD